MITNVNPAMIYRERLEPSQLADVIHAALRAQGWHIKSKTIQNPRGSLAVDGHLFIAFIWWVKEPSKGWRAVPYTDATHLAVQILAECEDPNGLANVLQESLVAAINQLKTSTEQECKSEDSVVA